MYPFDRSGLVMLICILKVEGIRMESNLTARYFRVSGDGPAPQFTALLKEIVSAPLPAREKDLNPGTLNPVIIRLERFEDLNGGFVAGELIRKQIREIPPEVSDNGLSPIVLSEGGGLGYSSVFVYHRQTGVLGIQSNTAAVTHKRLQYYCGAWNHLANYAFDPVVKQEAWERFNRGLPRKISIKLANPQQLNGLTNSALSVGEAAANLSEILNGPYVTIEVSMGQKKGSLAVNAVRQLVTQLRGFLPGQADVRKLTASVKAEGEEVDEINFLDEFLVYRDTIELPENDHERSYLSRRGALLQNFVVNLTYIQSIYGTN
jgi:hypothetical protein